MVNKRKLGMSELMVPPLTFGGNVFGWTVDEPSSFKILDTLFDFGFNFVDTADAYSIWARDSLTTLTHFSVSLFMKSRISSGVLGCKSMAWLMSAALVSG